MPDTARNVPGRPRLDPRVSKPLRVRLISESTFYILVFSWSFRL